jgi:predicted O-linked N-acetylglucosamine transferase (SPINDLY family)
VAIAAKEILEVDNIDVLADKGYHTGSELKKVLTSRSSRMWLPWLALKATVKTLLFAKISLFIISKVIPIAVRLEFP